MQENILCLRLHGTLRDHDKRDSRNEDTFLRGVVWCSVAWHGVLEHGGVQVPLKVDETSPGCNGRVSRGRGGGGALGLYERTSKWGGPRGRRCPRAQGNARSFLAAPASEARATRKRHSGSELLLSSIRDTPPCVAFPPPATYATSIHLQPPPSTSTYGEK